MLKKLIFFVTIFGIVCCKSISKESGESEEEHGSNDTVPQDLYVIKTVVYEVGILTDPSNETNATETREEVDLSFFGPSNNGSGIDLSNIPLPIQTNVSGVTVTGVVPGADLASILLPSGENKPFAAILPQKQIHVTQNISTNDPDKGSEIITNLPKILGLAKKQKEVDQEKEE